MTISAGQQEQQVILRQQLSRNACEYTSIPLVPSITKVVCVEGYFENAMIECGNVGSTGKLEERAIDLVDRMIELSSFVLLRRHVKTCEAVGMVEAYRGNDDDLSTRRGAGCRECGRDAVKAVREGRVTP